jgi:hypothetical protein
MRSAGIAVMSTLDVVSGKKTRPELSAEETAAKQFVLQAKEQGLSLTTGPDGCWSCSPNNVLETPLNEEMTAHLEHEGSAPRMGVSRRMCATGPGRRR